MLPARWVWGLGVQGSGTRIPRGPRSDLLTRIHRRGRLAAGQARWVRGAVGVASRFRAATGTRAPCCLCKKKCIISHHLPSSVIMHHLIAVPVTKHRASYFHARKGWVGSWGRGPRPAILTPARLHATLLGQAGGGPGVPGFRTLWAGSRPMWSGATAWGMDIKPLRHLRPA